MEIIQTRRGSTVAKQAETPKTTDKIKKPSEEEKTKKTLTKEDKIKKKDKNEKVKKKDIVDKIKKKETVSKKDKKSEDKSKKKESVAKVKKKLGKMAAEGLVKPVSVLSKVRTMEKTKTKGKHLSASQKRKLEQKMSKKLLKKALVRKQAVEGDDDVLSETEVEGTLSQKKTKLKDIKQGNKVKTKDLIAQKVKTISKITPVKRQFIMPAVSSRSSRKIIPNKRFIEESEELMKSPKPKPTPTPVPVPTSANQTVTEPLTIDITENNSALESSTPVQSGKRTRKPSMKMIEKLCGEDNTSVKSSSPVKAEAAAESEATKGRVNSILKKAKLRLSKKKMRKLTTSVARSLKRQMKKEGTNTGEEVEKTLLRLNFSPTVSPTSALGETSVLLLSYISRIS